MNKRVVSVDLDERSYDIFIGAGLLDSLTDMIPLDIKGRSVFVIYDEAVADYAEVVQSCLKNEDAKTVEPIAVSSGENSKQFSEVERITNHILDKGVSRTSLIVAVGGGVIGDLAGFCASVILRGIPFVQIPTTLLSQVDSSVGGKTGINTQHGKNLIGAFYQPSAVIIDIETLKTLPQRQVLSGYAEVVKYGLIKDAQFFNWLDQNGQNVCALDQDALMHAIEVSVKAKAEIVKADETEKTGMRALLNLGHTFAHALEAATEYDGRLLHGEAVAIGIVMAFVLSERIRICNASDVQRVRDHFKMIGLPITLNHVEPAITEKAQDLIEIMRRDKKATEGRMQFIVTGGIGNAYTHDDIEESDVAAVLLDGFGVADSDGDKNLKRSGLSIQDKLSLSDATLKEFKMKGVRGLWKSAFSSRS